MLSLSTILGLLSGCSYEPPLDPDAPDILNSISGSVVISGAAASDVVILVYSADDPPPPEGTGGPVSLAMVPGSSFTGEAGLLESSYLLTELPDGEYTVNALMDVDGDFHPLLGSNAGATCGDFAGTYPVSATELTSAVVSVVGGELASGVTVVIALEYPTERPAFVFSADTVSQTGLGGAFQLVSTGIHSEILDFSEPGTECGPIFLVRFTDDDEDGVADPHATFGDYGLLNAWPKVYLQYTGEGSVALEAGESYFTESPVYPTPYRDPKTGELALDTLIPTPILDVYFIPGVQHALPDGTVELVTTPDIPQGAWSVTVVAETGQTWTLPNALAGYPATDVSFDPLLQAGVLTITE